jgi:hypothetical protein
MDAARAKLVRYVGPIATVMVTRAARAAENEADFYLKLANFIESEPTAPSFCSSSAHFAESRAGKPLARTRVRRQE